MESRGCDIARPSGGRKPVPRALHAALLASTALVAAALTANPAFAQDATWLTDPTVAGPTTGTFNFNAGANWNTGTVPTGTAFFDITNGPNISFSANTSIQDWRFNLDASAYSFTNGQILTFAGGGITIEAGSPVFITNNNLLQFTNASSAASAAITTNSGAATRFFDNSTGGSAQLINNAGGTVDISTLTAASMTAGSIEGAGDFFLGSKEFQVGSNDLSTTVDGVIQDGGSDGGSGAILTKTGGGTLTLTAVNTYSGGTRLNGGALGVSADNQLGAAGGALTFNGGVLRVIGTAFTSTARTINWNGGGFDIADAANTFTVNQTLNDGGGVARSLIKSGAGTLRLTANNTYSGGTFVAGGAIEVISNSSAGTGSVELSGGTFRAGANGLNYSNTFLLSSQGTFDTNGNNLTLSGNITDGGDPGGLRKIGNGILTLSGTNAYSGITAIEAGTLVAASAGSLPNLSHVAVNSGAALTVSNNVSIGSLGDGTGGGGTVTIGNGWLLTVGSNDQLSTFSGILTGAGSLATTSSGELTLTGTGSSIGGNLTNNSLGGLVIDGGSLAVAGLTLINQGTLTVSNGGTLDSQTAFIGVGAGLSAMALVTGAGSVWTSANGLSIGGASGPGGIGSLTVADGGAVVISDPNQVIAVDSGSTLNLGNGGLAGTVDTSQVTLNGTGQLVANFTDTSTLAANIQGDGSVTKQGTGTLILTGDSGYTGGTTISGGTLQLGNGGSTGSIGGDIANNSILAINRTLGTTLTLDGVISGTGAVQQIGAGLTRLSGVNNYSGGTVIGGGILEVMNNSSVGTGTVTLDGGVFQAGAANLNFSNAFVLNSNVETINTDANTLTLSGIISDGGDPGGLTKIGIGTLILTGNNTYSGGTTVNEGTLQIGDNSNTGTIRGAVTNNDSVIEVVKADTSFITSITNNATTGDSTINFRNDTNAGPATITNVSNTPGIFAFLRFFDTSSAGSANITNNIRGLLEFYNSSSAGNATIVNNSADPLAVVFSDTSTAGAAQITNNAGFINFNNASKAGTASITNGSVVLFNGTSSAESANIVNNSGATINFDNQSTAAASTLDNSGNVYFFSTASGGSARFIAKSGGMFDISGLTSAGTTAGSIEGAGNYVLGGKSLTVGGNTLSTVMSGVISGSGGSLVKTGSETLALSGANTYTGGTTILGGTLQLGNGGTTGSVTGNIANNSVLAINRSNLFIYNGVISGTGALNQIGTGTTLLSGINTYTGATTIEDGALFVTGSIGNSAVTVANGGLLGGTGTVGGTTVNGMLSPGLSIGTITVSGNLAFSSAASYLVEVSPTDADRTNVTGTASLAGELELFPSAGTYTIGKQYTLLHADGGLTGTFTTGDISGMFGRAINARIAYDFDDVFLILDPNTISQFLPSTAGGNQRSVANAVNQVLVSGSTPPAFLNLFNFTGEGLNSAMSQLSGEANAGAQGAAMQLMNQYLSLLSQYRGTNGAGSGVSGFAPERQLSPEATAAYAAVTPKDKRAAFDPRWSLWGSGFGGHNKTSGDAAAGSHDTTARSYGFAGGADYRLTPDTVAGFALAGAGAAWGLSSGLGGGESDAFLIGGYAAQQFGPAYLSAALSYAWHSMRTDRQVTIAGTDRLRGEFDASSFGGRLEGGYRVATPYLGVTPYGAVQVQTFHAPSYSESVVSGSGAFALTYGSRDVVATRTELGAGFDKTITLDQGRELTLRSRAAWVHDFNPDSRFNAAFQVLPAATFTIDGAHAPANLALVSAAAELQLGKAWSASAKFDGEFASSSQTYAGTGTIRYAW